MNKKKKQSGKVTLILLLVIFTINIVGYILPHFSSLIDCSLITDSEGLGAEHKQDRRGPCPHGSL